MHVSQPLAADEPSFSWLRSIRLGTFHIGSSFADILGSSVWNYVMANGLGAAFMATPIALLLAMRQILVPLTVLAGHLSDTRPIFGFRRIPYIWIGRGLMLLGLPLLPVATTWILAGNNLGWALATVAFVIFGVGTQVSGSPFTALVRDSAPGPKQGVAYAVVQTMLVAAFAFSPLVYARIARLMLPNYNSSESGLRQYNLDVFWVALAVGSSVALLCWVISVIGQERRVTRSTLATAPPQQTLAEFRQQFGQILNDRRTRSFFVMLALGAMAGFAQDAVLEPSLRQVFDYDFGGAQGVVGAWGAGLLVGMLACIGITRNWPTHRQTQTTRLGLALSSLSMLLMAYTFASETAWLVIPAVTLFGLAFGIYTAGGSPLLMVMTREGQAGAYLGLWSMAQLLFRGVGIALGGIVYDVIARSTGSMPVGYATVYALEAVAFALALIFLQRADVRGFAQSAPRVSRAVLFSAGE